MDEYYRVPTLILLTLLVAVFVALYWRSRTKRSLLWMIGWTMAVIRLAFQLSPHGHSGWERAISNAALEMTALMFLGSLSPLEFGRRIRVQFVTVFAVLLVTFAMLVALHPLPGIFLRVVNVVLAVAAVAVAVAWSTRKNLLPVWFTVLFALTAGGACIYFTWIGEYEYVLGLAHSGNCIIAALLVLATYRRFSPGVVFTAFGLLIWSTPTLLDGLNWSDPAMMTFALRLINLMKVITAVGMIVLVLEDELTLNHASRIREQRAREEMARYSQLYLSGAPHRDFGIPYDQICGEIASASRFAQAAILVRGVERTFRIAGQAEMDAELLNALEAVGQQMTPRKLQLLSESKNLLADLGNTALAGLRASGAKPDGERKQISHSLAHVIPIRARSEGLLGLVILGGLKEPAQRLLAEDLLPLEILVTRLAAACENGLLLRQVSQSEKLAGLGQLAGGLAHELNNPLTVVLGYAELIEDSVTDEIIRRNAGVIRRESQRMKQIIESLARFWRPSSSELALVAVDEMLMDIGRLRRQEFERAGIQVEMTMARDLPRIMANGDQMRQVFLQILNNAMAALGDASNGSEKKVRIAVTHECSKVRVLITDTGPGFPEPERVFDPFFTTKAPGEGTGLGLSVCYSIIREHGGEISVSNLQPRGAAVVIELPSEKAKPQAAQSGRRLAGEEGR